MNVDAVLSEVEGLTPILTLSLRAKRGNLLPPRPGFRLSLAKA
jgi:hypothetical protein